MNGYISIIRKNYKPYNDEIDLYFIKDNGCKLPVYKNYRSSIKKWYKAFPSINILYDTGAEYQNYVTGRSISKPIAEINNDVYELSIKKISHLFINKNTINHSSSLIPNISIVRKEIKAQKRYKQSLLSKLKSFDINVSREGNLLEIGFISGGHSLFAFEDLGYSTFGIDNCYDGLSDNYADLPEYIKKHENYNTKFMYGDITERTQFDDKSMGIVFSESVLEHIMDLRSAFLEMKRILCDDGFIIHSYNPFFSVNGGHSLGLLDQPYGHLRLSESEYLRYLSEVRPYEYSEAKEWVEKALNKVSIAKMQKIIIQAGFDIILWQQTSAPKEHVDVLDNDVLNEIYEVYPYITLPDLISVNIFMVLKKSQT